MNPLALGPLGMVGAGAVGVVAVGWLAVSFMRPGPSRNRVAWLGAVALYVALLCFFVNLLRGSITRDSLAGMIGFGFLTAMFGMGLVVSTAKALGSLRERAASDASATN